MVDRRAIQAALRNPSLYSNRVYRAGVVAKGLAAMVGEEHARLRRIYNLFFVPQAIQRYEATIVRPIAVRVIEQLAKMESPDLVVELATKFPCLTVSTLFGLSSDHYERYGAWINTILRSLTELQDQSAQADARRAYDAMSGLLREVTEREMVRPGENLLGEVVRAMQAEGMGSYELLDRIPYLRLDPAEPPVFTIGTNNSPLFGPKTLRVRFERGPS